MSKVWLITDVVSEAGLELAETALEAGARVIAGVRGPARPTALAARYGRRMRVVLLDLADEASVYAALNLALSAFGRLDVVVDTSAKAEAGVIEATSDASLRAQFERGFFAIVGLAHAALPILRERGAGRIVHVASRDGDASAVHRAAKCAVRGYFEALAREAAEDGIEIAVIEADEAAGENFLAARDDMAGRRRGRIVSFPSRSAA